MDAEKIASLGTEMTAFLAGEDRQLRGGRNEFQISNLKSQNPTQSNESQISDFKSQSA
jgi:hypothetical protein